MSKKQVTACFLLEGAVYSLEQCGLLLRHAITLYKEQAYPSAIVLAAFAREELGRSQILFDLRKKVVNGDSMTVEDIRETCQDHIEKQKRAQLSTVQGASGEQRLAKLHRTILNNDPQNKEYQKAIKQLNDVTSRQRKRTPMDRHELRMRALYVEPDDTGTSWNRPCEISQDKARLFLEHAVNDYAGKYDRIQGGSIRDIDPDLDKALKEWHGRPVISSPQWSFLTVKLQKPKR